MVYLAALLVATTVTGACLWFAGRARSPAESARRWAIAALIVAGPSAGLIAAADALPGEGDLANGSLGLLGFLLWFFGIPMEIGAVIQVARAARAGRKTTVMSQTLLVALALTATWYRTVLG
jgi:hypothetical protein